MFLKYSFYQESICFLLTDIKLGILSGMKNTVSGGEMREVASSDDEGWQEREASRTHSVKFTDELPEVDKEVSIAPA